MEKKAEKKMRKDGGRSADGGEEQTDYGAEEGHEMK
jgi:hypothetical protein